MEPEIARPVTISIEGQFATFELATLIAFLRCLNGPDSPRHWNITIKDDGMALAEAEDLLRRFFPVVSIHPSDLGPIIAPCWTRLLRSGDVQIRLWTGYSWLEFGSDQHLSPDEVERLSEPLEPTDV